MTIYAFRRGSTVAAIALYRTNFEKGQADERGTDADFI